MYRTVAAFFVSLTPVLAGQVAVTITDSYTGNAIPHALVTINGPRESVAEAETGATGNYTFEQIAEGQYQVTVTKANYLKTTATVILTEVTAVTKVRISLVPTAVITGRVTDPQDRGLRGARVFLIPAERGGASSWALNPLYSDFTDDTGQYRMYGIVPGTYSIGAVVPAQGRLANQLIFGSTGTAETRYVLEGGATLNLNFSAIHGAGGSIVGRLNASGACDFDEYGVTLASAEHPIVVLQTTMTGKDRAFRFGDLPVGPYILFVAGRTIGRAAQGQVLSPQRCFGRQDITLAHTEQEVVVTATAPASVNLAPAQAEQVAECHVPVAVRLTPTEAWNAVAAVDASFDPKKGTVITGLAPGRHVLTSHGSCAISTQEVLAREGNMTHPIKTSRVRTAIILGKILLRSAESHFEILLQQSGAAALVSTTCNRDGTFQFPQVPEGHYRLLLRSATGAATHDIAATRGTTYVEIPEP